MSWLTEKRLNRGLGVVFLIVGVLATWNTARLNNYISDTLPRDQHQEDCQDATLQVLSGWVAERKVRDQTENAKDTASIAVINKWGAGAVPTPQELQAWAYAIAADRDIRLKATEEHSPLPNC
jgi:hypothetical protein